MDSVIHNRKNIYHTIIHFNNILIIKRISMIDSSKKMYLSYFYCKRLRDSILSPFFHSYIFAMYKNEALWI